MGRCTGHHDITQIVLQTALNRIQSIFRDTRLFLITWCNASLTNQIP